MQKSSATSIPPVGFIGLGDMGLPMASNIASALKQGSGAEVCVFDLKKPHRIEAGLRWCENIEAVAAATRVLFVSVPDEKASAAVLESLADCQQSQVEVVINLSTVGVDAAKRLQGICESRCENNEGMRPDYIDAPVSGGKAGAIKGTITVIWGGSKQRFDSLQTLLAYFSGSRFFVGDEPGQGQAVKLLNNFLSAVAMTASSEAVRFGLHHGVDMKTILDVVHVSTGQNTAISDKFPNRILSETYDAGFRMELMQKDVSLYLGTAVAELLPHNMAQQALQYFDNGLAAYPQGDFTEVFKVIDKKTGE